MNRAQKILLAGELILIGATVACVRPEPQATNSGNTEQPTAAQGEVNGDGQAELPNTDNGAEQVATVTEATIQPTIAPDIMHIPGLENTTHHEVTNFIRRAIPTTVTTTGIPEGSPLIISDIAASQALIFAEKTAGSNVFTEEDLTNIEGAVTQLRETSNRQVIINFYNADLVSAALSDLEFPIASASSEARQKILENAIVIDVPVRAEVSDLEINFQVATQLFGAILETNVEDPVRNENVSQHVTESLGLAYACAQKRMTYEDYLKWYQIGAYGAGITDGTQSRVTRYVYGELGYLPSLLTITK